MRIKINLNNLEDKIATLVEKSKSQFCQREGYGILLGLQILNSYLREICERAIDINDAILLSNLMNLGIINADSVEEEKQIHEEANKLRKE